MVETFQDKAQLLAQENADLRDSVHHLAQMVIAGSPKTVGVDKAVQAEPAVADKEVQTVSRTYADVRSQTEREEEKVEFTGGTGAADDEEMIDATVPKPTKLRAAASPSAKNPTNNTATGHTARAFVVHGVAWLGPMAAKIQEVERAFGTKVDSVIGVRWLLKGSRRWGKAASSLVIFIKSAVPTAIEMYVRMRGRKHMVVEYEWDREPGRVAPW